MNTLLNYFNKRSACESDDASSVFRVTPIASPNIEAAIPPAPVDTQDQTEPHAVFSAASMDVQTKSKVVQCAEKYSVAEALRQFPGLKRSTVSRWMELVRAAREKALSKCPAGAMPLPIDYTAALKDGRLSNGRHLPQQALDAAFNRFESARSEGVPVSSRMLRQMVVSAVTEVDPDIVWSPSNPSGWFRCSDIWLRLWKQEWNIGKRRATTARRSQLTDLEDIRATFLKRVAYVVHKFGILPELTFHADETGVCLHPSPGTTLDFKGAKTIAVLGSSDKRQATVMLGGALDGTVLRPQVIFEGKSARVLPKYPTDAVECTFTPNHWASYDTTTQWLATVLVPHASAQKSRLGLGPDHPCLLIWDVWHNHKSPEMLAHIQEH